MTHCLAFGYDSDRLAKATDAWLTPQLVDSCRNHGGHWPATVPDASLVPCKSGLPDM